MAGLSLWSSFSQLTLSEFSSMREDFISYIWQQKLFDFKDLATEEGESIEILNFGSLNTDSGPDFFNGKIKIGQTLWAGNIEIHVKSSDWKLHKHNENPAFDNVILHVVYEADVKIISRNNNKIPCLSLKNRIDASVLSKFRVFQKNGFLLPCHSFLNKIDPFVWSFWKERLIVERIEYKTRIIESYLKQSNNDWQYSFYRILMKAFGLNVNQIAFENLSSRISLTVLLKLKDCPFKTEALLFGVSGLLEKFRTDEYLSRLKMEYKFLKNKFQLSEMSYSTWKFSRMRPINFPSIKIAQLAAIISHNKNLYNSVLQTDGSKELIKLFEYEPSQYWSNHFVFGKQSKSISKKPGNLTIHSILINAIIPFKFLYNKHNKTNLAFQDELIEMLRSLPAEKNKICSDWASLKVPSKNALDSQALIHLKKNYCDQKKCMFCDIGVKILRSP